MTAFLEQIFLSQIQQLDDAQRAKVIHQISECRFLPLVFSNEQIEFFQNLPVFKMRDGQLLSLIEMIQKYEGFFFQPLYAEQENEAFWTMMDESESVLINKECFGDLDIFQFHGEDEKYAFKVEYEKVMVFSIFENFRRNLNGSVLVKLRDFYKTEFMQQLGEIYVQAHNIEIRPRDFFDRRPDDLPIGDLDENRIEYETLILEKRRKEFCGGYGEAYLSEKGLSLDSVKQRGQEVLQRYNHLIKDKNFKIGEYADLVEYIHSEIEKAT